MVPILSKICWMKTICRVLDLLVDHCCPEWLKGYYVNYNATTMNLIRELPPFFASLNCPMLSSMDTRFFLDMFAGHNASLLYIH